MLGYDSLQNHYRTNFILMQDHHYSLSDIESMIPWEKFIYIDMINARQRAEEDRRRQAEGQRKR